MLNTALRTHTCGELTEREVKKKVVLSGWVDSVRNYGPLIFVNLRDRYGITQVVLESKKENSLKQVVESLKKEDVIKVEGSVRQRPKEMINPKQSTGHVEVVAEKINILNKASPLPLDESIDSSEEVRLKYRYLDLRSSRMQNNLITRHKIVKAARDYLDSLNFVELETPILAKSTPEGARDYLVPSRVNKGQFYALPQSPQLFKQLLMLSGFDRYFQVARCFRDEDLRADRQPEFTQIDIEMSFVEQEDIMKIVEGLMEGVFKSVGKKVKLPFPILTYNDAVSRYGLDKPDTRFGLELVDVTSTASKSDFNVFKDAVKSGGVVKCICVEKGGVFSRKDIDELTEIVKTHKAKGLAWLKVAESGELEGAIAKFFSDPIKKELLKNVGAKKGDLILFVADHKHSVVNTSLGYLRVDVAKKLKIIPDIYNLLWVVDFPLLEYDENLKRHLAVHHPFTSPKNEFMDNFDKHPEKARAKAYDIVLNGSEIGGGSIRIYNPEVQERMFKTLGIEKKEAHEKFGFLLEAFKYGAPPHGGIALGLDRISAILTGNDSIRDVIAFPKNKNARCLMQDSPSAVDNAQLDEIGVSVKK